MSRRITPKEKKFADKYIETDNATQSVNAVYDVKNNNVAGNKGSRLLRSANIKGYLESEADEAKNRIVELSKLAENESVRLSANKDICDRTHGKSAQSMDITTQGESFNVPEEKKMSITDKLKSIL